MDLAALSLDCPACGHRLYKMRAGQWTIQNRIVKLEAGRVLIGCDKCRADFEVPWLSVSVGMRGGQRVSAAV